MQNARYRQNFAALKADDFLTGCSLLHRLREGIHLEAVEQRREGGERVVARNVLNLLLRRDAERMERGRVR